MMQFLNNSNTWCIAHLFVFMHDKVRDVVQDVMM
jgi:hypothetical protein